MNITANLCTLALSPLIKGACKAVGMSVGDGAISSVVGLLTQHFTDQSSRLTEAMRRTHERSWKALEVALAGDSLWDRCKLVFTSAEERAFREQVRPFLDACSFAEMQGKAAYRQACLTELRAANKVGLLTGGTLDPAQLARDAGAFARFSDPKSLLDAETQHLARVGDELRRAGYENLAGFVTLRPQSGDPILVLAVRFFFRRAVEDDQALFQGLAFAQMEGLHHAQDAAFRALERTLVEQGDRLEKMLSDLRELGLATLETVTETRGAVLDVLTEQRRQGQQNADLYNAVLDLQKRLDLSTREVRASDSLSLRNDAERRLVKDLVGRYRALPETERARLPALLNAIGRLEIAAGDFQAAQSDFTAVVNLVGEPKAQAEAHWNAYHAALERRDWTAALAELREAVRLDVARFAPFPFGKYQPERILGAGGFGVAFLCKHRRLNAPVVVKTLQGDDLDRDVDTLFAEAQTLRQLDHAAIIRLQDCDFAGENDSRPYLVMDYFEGQTLEEAARQMPLTADDLLAVARLTASGLRAAHGKGILHRDVKPANLLVRRPPVGEPGASATGGDRAWQVRLIDFGLALRKKGNTVAQATSQTILGSSIAGTLEYAAPEQMGKLPGVAVSPASDVYGFAKTCCYAAFQTAQPLPRHWRSLPVPLAELLEECLEEQPSRRPHDFQTVLNRLDALAAPPKPTVAPKPPPAMRPAPRPVVTLSQVQSSSSTKPATDMTVAERQEALAELSRQVAGCTRCHALASSRRNTVFGVGPLDPDILFLGEAPGGEEDQCGEPFVGPAGHLLNDMLREVGLQRENAYVTNMLKCRPPGNRQPQPLEVTNCREYLNRQLELIRPRTICALGGVAAQNLLGTTESIGRMRGSFRAYQGIPVLCTYHPAFLLPHRSPHKRREVVEDLRLLLRQVRK